MSTLTNFSADADIIAHPMSDGTFDVEVYVYGYYMGTKTLQSIENLSADVADFVAKCVDNYAEEATTPLYEG